MKNTQKLTSKLLAAASICLLSVACSKSDDKKSDESRRESQLYVYSFEYNGCKTGEHQFNSIEALCAGLQDEALNKGCAQGMREDEFNFKSCPGTFSPKMKPTPAPHTTPSTGQPRTPGKQSLKGFEEKTLKKDEVISDVFRSSPQESPHVIQDIIELTCISSAEELESRQLTAGVLMLNQSQLTIVPDWNNTSLNLPSTRTFKCPAGNVSGKIGDLIGDKKVQKRALKVNQSMLEVIKTAGLDSTATTSFTYVSCNKDAVQAAFSGLNGISLTVGSSILIHRDNEYKFADGTTTKDHAPFVQFTCE